MMDREKAIEVLQRMADDKTEELHICDDEGGSVCGLILEEQNAILAGIEALKEQRPHGEWRDYSNDGYVECPFCDHATNCNDNIKELHYCFYCGAAMRPRERKGE